MALVIGDVLCSGRAEIVVSGARALRLEGSWENVPLGGSAAAWKLMGICRDRFGWHQAEDARAGVCQ